MSWMLIADAAFYAVVGVMTLPLVVLVVASVLGLKFDAAYLKVKGFLTTWAEIPGQDFVDKLLNLVRLLRKRSGRAASAAGISAAALLVSFALWVEREEQYMDNLLGCYMSEYARHYKGTFPPRPEHFPVNKWPRRAVAPPARVEDGTVGGG